MNSDELQTATKDEIDWRHARVPTGALFVYYRCAECGHTITVSPRSNTGVLPSMYCNECENGPPFSKYAVEFKDGVVYRPGYEDAEPPQSEDST